MQEAYAHCEALVREQDRERFLSGLFADAAKRRHLYALYAFDIEISRVPDAVREPMAGEIRFQWWRDVLAGERAAEAQANPVAAALLDTISQCDLSAVTITSAIDARQFDLIGEPMETREGLAKYLAEVKGSIFALAARVLDPGWDAATASQLAGHSAGYIDLLRNLPHDLSKGRMFVPLDLLAAHEVHTVSVFAGENSSGLRTALNELLVAAETDFAHLREIDMPQSVLPAFLKITLTSAYAARLRRAAGPFQQPIALSRLRSQFLLWRAARRGKL